MASGPCPLALGPQPDLSDLCGIPGLVAGPPQAGAPRLVSRVPKGKDEIENNKQKQINYIYNLPNSSIFIQCKTSAKLLRDIIFIVSQRNYKTINYSSMKICVIKVHNTNGSREVTESP